MKFSKFVHCYHLKENSVALFHSLYIDTIFLLKQDYFNLKTVMENGDLDKENASSSHKYLIDKGFIIDSEDNDEHVLNNALKYTGEDTLINTYVVVTELCNFNCKYCFISEAVQSNAISKNMSLSTAKKAAHLLQNTFEKQRHLDAERTVTFYGGEPLLNFKAIQAFIEEVNAIKKNNYWPENFRYVVITNASLLNESIISYFKKNAVTVGISYDGYGHSGDSRITTSGASTQALIESKLKLCRDNDLPFTLSVTVTNDFLLDQDKQLAYLISLKPYDISFNMLIPNIQQSQNEDYYSSYTLFIIKAFVKLRELGIAEDRMMRKVTSFVTRSLYIQDCCAAGGNQYVISPQGEVGICHGYLNDRKYFTNKTELSIDFNYLHSPNFSMWRKRIPLLMSECKDCECLGICGGGCPYAAEKLHGNIFELDHRFCIHAKLILQWLIEELYNNLENKNSKTSLL